VSNARLYGLEVKTLIGTMHIVTFGSFPAQFVVSCSQYSLEV
jgi:hypothetical protein